ncbi:MAG: hypothetical protein ACHQSE_12690 [Gemmatimonadales bacterium]
MRPKYTPRAATLLAIVLVAAVSACGDKSPRQAGGAPAREIQLAPNGAAQPQLNDVPAASAASGTSAPKPEQKEARVATAPPRHVPEPKVTVRPLTPQDNPSVAAAPATVPAPVAAPAPVAPAPAPTVGTVSAGTSFAVHPAGRVCTNTFKPGDRFTATVSESVAGSDGAVIPAGSSVVLKVDESTRSINSKDSLKLTFSAVSLRIGEQSYDLTGHVSQTAPLEKVRVQSTGDQAKKVGAGALIGALAGQLLGKNTRSTVIGGAVGAAAGAAVAAGTADYDGCVPATANLLVNLEQPLRIKLLPY